MSDDRLAPNQEQLDTARAFARTFRNERKASGAPVRHLFVRTVDGPPSLSRLINRAPESRSSDGAGGRGGAVRVKLYLSLIWVCAKAPYSTIRPARAWAALLGLDEPETNGARRIRTALGELEKRGFIRLEKHGPGIPPEIFLLEESGTGSPYTIPFSNFGAANVNSTRHEYFRIPEGFWTQGIISSLSTAGLVMLLILLSESQGKPKGIWFSPANSRIRYEISDGTRKAGLNELHEEGLVKVRRQAQAPGSARVMAVRSRNVYTVQFDKFSTSTELVAAK